MVWIESNNKKFNYSDGSPNLILEQIQIILQDHQIIHGYLGNLVILIMSIAFDFGNQKHAVLRIIIILLFVMTVIQVCS